MEKTITFQEYLSQKNLNSARSSAQIFDAAWQNTSQAKKVRRNKKIARNLFLLGLSTTGTITMYKAVQFIAIDEGVTFITRGVPTFVKFIEEIGQDIARVRLSSMGLPLETGMPLEVLNLLK